MPGSPNDRFTSSAWKMGRMVAMVYRRAHSGNGSIELTPDCTDGAHARSKVLRAGTAKFSHSRWATRQAMVARAKGPTRQRRSLQFVTPREICGRRRLFSLLRYVTRAR